MKKAIATLALLVVLSLSVFAGEDGNIGATLTNDPSSPVFCGNIGATFTDPPEPCSGVNSESDGFFSNLFNLFG